MPKQKITKKRKSFMRDSDEESHHSQFQLNLKEKKLMKYQGKKNGHWDQTERSRYFLFIDANKRIFASQKLQRVDLIFTMMAKLIETRSCYQCKAHHQKMIKKYGNFQGILYALKEDKSTKISEQISFDFRLDEQQFLCDLENLVSNKQQFCARKQESYVQEQSRSEISIEKSLRIEDIPFFGGNSDQVPSPQLIGGFNYSIHNNLSSDPLSITSL